MLPSSAFPGTKVDTMTDTETDTLADTLADTMSDTPDVRVTSTKAISARHRNLEESDGNSLLEISVLCVKQFTVRNM